MTLFPISLSALEFIELTTAEEYVGSWTNPQLVEGQPDTQVAYNAAWADGDYIKGKGYGTPVPASLTSVNVYYKLKVAGYKNDNLILEYSPDNGSNWYVVKTYTEASPPPTTLTEVSFSASYITSWSAISTTLIRIRVERVPPDDGASLSVDALWLRGYYSQLVTPIGYVDADGIPDDVDTISVAPGGSFSIDISVSNIINLWGYQFILYYNTIPLTATDFTSYAPFTLPWPSEINDEAGYVAIAYSMPMGTWEGASDTIVPLAKIDFIVAEASPNSSLDGYFDNTGVWVEEGGFVIVAEPLKLDLNGPNPFSQKTTISYKIPTNSKVALRVYDTSGKLVETLINGVKKSGYYAVDWNTERVADGIYFLRLKTEEKTITKKIVIVK